MTIKSQNEIHDNGKYKVDKNLIRVTALTQ